jgi:hypothetical protein
MPYTGRPHHGPRMNRSVNGASLVRGMVFEADISHHGPRMNRSVNGASLVRGMVFEADISHHGPRMNRSVNGASLVRGLSSPAGFFHGVSCLVNYERVGGSWVKKQRRRLSLVVDSGVGTPLDLMR